MTAIMQMPLMAATWQTLASDSLICQQQQAACNYASLYAGEAPCQDQPHSKRIKTSQYRGVAATSSGLWRSGIRFKNHSLQLGRFKDEQDAAMAYDRAASLLLGNSAKLNFKGRHSDGEGAAAAMLQTAASICQALGADAPQKAQRLAASGAAPPAPAPAAGAGARRACAQLAPRADTTARQAPQEQLSKRLPQPQPQAEDDFDMQLDQIVTDYEALLSKQKQEQQTQQMQMQMAAAGRLGGYGGAVAAAAAAVAAVPGSLPCSGDTAACAFAAPLLPQMQHMQQAAPCYGSEESACLGRTFSSFSLDALLSDTPLPAPALVLVSAAPKGTCPMQAEPAAPAAAPAAPLQGSSGETCTRASGARGSADGAMREDAGESEGACGRGCPEYAAAIDQLGRLLDSDPQVLLLSLMHAFKDGDGAEERPHHKKRGRSTEERRAARRERAAKQELQASAVSAVSALIAVRARRGRGAGMQRHASAPGSLGWPRGSEACAGASGGTPAGLHAGAGALHPQSPTGVARSCAGAAWQPGCWPGAAAGAWGAAA